MSQFPPPPVNPDDLGRGPLIMGISWALAIVAGIAVALRFHVRIQLANGLASDDWFMGIALAFNFVSQAFVTVGYTYGLGKHDADLRMDQMMNVLKWMWLANTPGLIVSITARVSIAILLVRLFGVHAWLKWFVITVTSICTIVTIVILPCTYLQSNPVEGNWNPMLPAKRWNPQIWITLAFLAQSLWTFTDLTFVLFPVMVIWRLQMALRQRIGLVLIMSVSLFTMALSIVKTISFQQIADQQNNPTATDVQYDATLTILWTTIEQAFVILMGCIPPLRSISRLKISMSISESLSSMLRTKKSSQMSSSAPSSRGYAASNGPYYEMSKDKSSRNTPSVGAPKFENTPTVSQQELTNKKTDVYTITETRGLYSRSFENV